MKVLGIVGSPRKGGNTDLLVRELLGAAGSEGAETEIVYLADLDVRCCDGCGACRSTGECMQADGMIGLYDKLFASDAWVLGTPMYYWDVSGLMKCFIDRLYFVTGPEQIKRVKGKKLSLVCALGGSDFDTAVPMVNMARKLARRFDMPFAGELVVSAYAKGEVASNEKAMSDARDLGRLVAQQAKIEG